MERDPLDVVEQHESGRDQQLAKVLDRNAVLLMSLEVDPRLGEKLDRFGGVHVVVDAELKVELPRADARGEFAVLVAQSQAELDDPEQVDVTPQSLVVVVARPAKRPDWSCDDSRELSVLRGALSSAYSGPESATSALVAPRSRARRETAGSPWRRRGTFRSRRGGTTSPPRGWSSRPPLFCRPSWMGALKVAVRRALAVLQTP